ncbi:histidine kinase N-terminal 7TM domain-containing protein [Haloferax sp. S1W]|uniref:histidine kinase N-terminal 7TM domain-containing protein n=1 Tax=Haloferax sp. S1W TaxID=3377110 RepID=UPI0037C6C71F
MHGASHWQSTPYTVPLGVGAGIFLALGVYLLRRRMERQLVPGATLGAFLLFASGFWMGMYTLELARTDFATKVLLNQLGYIGIAPIPLLWLAYVIRHTDVADIPRSGWLALGTVPVFTIGLVLTNDWHGLIWDGLWLSRESGYVILVNDHGIAFVGYIVYAYVLIVIGIGLLVRELVRADGIYRKQTVGLFLGGLVPAVAGVVYVLGASPVPGLNLPTLAFSFAAATVAWSVLRHRLFTLVPVAWESAVESMQVAAFVIDANGTILAVNPAGEQCLSADRIDAYGRPAVSVLPEPLAEAVEDDDNPSEVTLVCDGEQKDVLVETNFLGEDGDGTGRLLLVRDITKRKARERRLERQNARLDEFASVVSHDLQNPLTVARGYLKLAQETGDDGHFERVEEAHDRMEAIIQDLLTLARQGETLSDLSPVDIGTVAREAWDGVAAEDVTVEVALDRTIMADRGRLRQLFENLFRNSAEHGVGSGSSAVTVVVGAVDDGFYVEDDGPGIPESDREQVFERGYTTHDDGTGLGLPIVRSVAEAHGWSVDVTDGSSGGARFEFRGVEDVQNDAMTKVATD